MKHTIIEGEKKFVIEDVGTPNRDVFVTLETPEVSQTHYAGYVLKDGSEHVAMQEKFIFGEVKHVAAGRTNDRASAVWIVAKRFIYENPDLFMAEEVER